jgi:CBS domain-containing protein
VRSLWRTTDAAAPPEPYGHGMSTNTPTSLNLARIPVRGAMQLGLFECTPDADLRAVAQLMAEKTIHCVVVAGERWGIVSDIDLMSALGFGLETVTAGDVAATDLVVVEPGDSLEHAAQLMAEHDTAHLIVASPDTGRPVGIVSTLDIARIVATA